MVASLKPQEKWEKLRQWWENCKGTPSDAAKMSARMSSLDIEFLIEENKNAA